MYRIPDTGTGRPGSRAESEALAAGGGNPGAGPCPVSGPGASVASDSDSGGTQTRIMMMIPARGARRKGHKPHCSALFPSLSLRLARPNDSDIETAGLSRCLPGCQRLGAQFKLAVPGSYPRLARPGRAASS